MSSNDHIENYDVLVRRSVLADVVWTKKEAEAFALKWQGILGIPVCAEALYVDGLIYFKKLTGADVMRDMQSHPIIDTIEGSACCLLCGTLEDPFVGCEHVQDMFQRDTERLERKSVQMHTGGVPSDLAE